MNKDNTIDKHEKKTRTHISLSYSRPAHLSWSRSAIGRRSWRRSHGRPDRISSSRTHGSQTSRQRTKSYNSSCRWDHPGVIWMSVVSYRCQLCPMGVSLGVAVVVVVRLCIPCQRIFFGYAICISLETRWNQHAFFSQILTLLALASKFSLEHMNFYE